MDNFAIIYKILKYLEKAMDYDEPDMRFVSAEHLKISENRWSSIIEMMVKKGYVEGYTIERSADGEVLIFGSELRITLDGLEYLHDNSLMQKAAKLAKGIIETVTWLLASKINTLKRIRRAIYESFLSFRRKEVSMDEESLYRLAMKKAQKKFHGHQRFRSKYEPKIPISAEREYRRHGF